MASPLTTPLASLWVTPDTAQPVFQQVGRQICRLWACGGGGPSCSLRVRVHVRTVWWREGTQPSPKVASRSSGRTTAGQQPAGSRSHSTFVLSNNASGSRAPRSLSVEQRDQFGLVSKRGQERERCWPLGLQGGGDSLTLFLAFGLPI